MSQLVAPIQNLIDAFSRLQGIGRKSATRLAFQIIRDDGEIAKNLADALLEVKERVRFCEQCANLCVSSPCELCQAANRNRSIICVVESPQDLLAIEATGEFSGMYHILHGVIAPLDGITPADLKIKELLERLRSDEVKEIILATNPSVEGEATALYLKKLIEPLGIKLTRIASGLPMGAQLEFADKATLGRSLLDRRQL
ncbi:MAG: recombination mediator RecR [Bradymonadales bacterium]